MLEGIFAKSLPVLEPKLHPCPTTITVNALLEIVTLLQALLVILTPASVRKLYVQRRPIPVQNLLLILPLPDLGVKVDDETSGDQAQEGAVLRRQVLHIEVARLVAAVAGVVGKSTTVDCILPSVNM